VRVINGRHYDPEEDAEEQGGVDISIIGRSFEAELAKTAVAEECDAKQRSQEHASVSEVKDGPRHVLERGLTDKVEGYDIDGTVDHERKTSRPPAAMIGQSLRGGSEESVGCVAAICGAALSSSSAHMMSAAGFLS